MGVARVLISVVAFAVLMQYASAAETPAQRGGSLLRAQCGQCHAVGRTGNSPFAPAPPFRTLHKRYPIEYLEEALGEGLVTGHPAMPEFAFRPTQVRDIIQYLRSLQR